MKRFNPSGIGARPRHDLMEQSTGRVGAPTRPSHPLNPPTYAGICLSIVVFWLSLFPASVWAQEPPPADRETESPVHESGPPTVVCASGPDVTPQPLSHQASPQVRADVAVLCPPAPSRHGARYRKPSKRKISRICEPKISMNREGIFLDNGSLDGKESAWTTTLDTRRDQRYPHYWARNVHVVDATGCDESLHQSLRLVLVNPPEDTHITLIHRKPQLLYRLRHGIRAKQPSDREFTVELRAGDKVLDRHVAHLSVKNKWTASMFAGAGVSVYRPNGAESEESTWTGVNLEYVLNNWKNNTEHSGPGFGKVLVHTTILTTEEREELTLKYGFGYRLSWERQVDRDVLIPYYGLDFGGIYGPQGTKTHHSFQITPNAGLALYTNEHVSLTATGGYVLPLSESLEAQRGWSATIGLHLYLW